MRPRGCGGGRRSQGTGGKGPAVAAEGEHNGKPTAGQAQADNDPLVHQCAEATAQIMALTARLEVSEARAIEAEAGRRADKAVRLADEAPVSSPAAVRWKSSTRREVIKRSR